MNKVRRKNIGEIINRLTVIKSQASQVLMEEEFALSQYPEAFEDSDRYRKSEDACEYIEDAIDSLDDCIGNMHSAMA